MSLNQEKHQSPHHVVIVGGGFAGLEAAKMAHFIGHITCMTEYRLCI